MIKLQIVLNRNQIIMKIPVTIIILLTVLISGCLQNGKPEEKQIDIIPKPLSVKKLKGVFKVNKATEIIIAGNKQELMTTAEYLSNFIEKSTGIKLQITGQSKKNNTIILQYDNYKEYGEEGYSLLATPDKVVVRAATPAGIFYGIQTLLQLLPPVVYSDNEKDVGNLEVPCVEIFDKPQFKWRGMHLDVSRHFFPKDFIKRYIDMIAMHKMNVFHWHLTDDNGWRIEIKKYPDLTRVCAWRVPRENWSDNAPPRPDEKPDYGGFYSQKDIKEIVEYAKRRYVTVVPEIEMPGHTSEVFAAYPQYSCKGKKLYVQPGSYWPNEDIFCAGNDSVFVFIKNILDEVIELFPSEYIHIGGDEAIKTNWKKCAKCRQRIIDEGLKDEDELQSLFMERIARYLISKGKKPMGWDEILEGGAPSGTAIMSWRGFDGGFQAASQGHNVVMCPMYYCYFNNYQEIPVRKYHKTGSYIPLLKVYSFNPVPKELADSSRRYILGAQGNIWTEYIKTTENVEYKALPRMAALSEVLWTNEKERNWIDFRKRLITQTLRYDYAGLEYSHGSFVINLIPEKQNDNSYLVRTEGEQLLLIRYTTDGTNPTAKSYLYTRPVKVDKSTVLKAAYFHNDSIAGPVCKKRFVFHKAYTGNITLEQNPAAKYSANGAQTLTDALLGGDNYADGNYLGFDGKDMIARISFDKPENIKSVECGFIQNRKSWIFMPYKVKYTLLNGDDKIIAEKIVETKTGQHDDFAKEFFKADFDTGNVLTVKIHAYSIIKCPEWHPGAGGKAWIFADEIIVE
jgi:hexosaminidase